MSDTSPPGSRGEDSASVGLRVEGVTRKSPTLHDFPYNHPKRKCYHKWIINVAPPGRHNCSHGCVYCYAREAIYARSQPGVLRYYRGLADMVERELDRIRLCPPVSLCNATDPCQPVPPLREETRRLVEMLLSRGASLSVITKGDPGFLLELPWIRDNPRVFVAVTVEGPPEVLSLLSPQAPPFHHRIEILQKVNNSGVSLSVRLDPVFPHLYRALYGESWMEVIEELIALFRSSGARHLIASTGTLTPRAKRRLLQIIQRLSPREARSFASEYLYDREYPSQGFRLTKDLRVGFHRRLRELCESRGLTYSACIELETAVADTPGLPHCEAYPTPFCIKRDDGSFQPLEGCTANCHVNCRDNPRPPCGRPQLAQPAPFKVSWLR